MRSFSVWLSIDISVSLIVDVSKRDTMYDRCIEQFIIGMICCIIFKQACKMHRLVRFT